MRATLHERALEAYKADQEKDQAAFEQRRASVIKHQTAELAKMLGALGITDPNAPDTSVINVVECNDVDNCNVRIEAVVDGLRFCRTARYPYEIQLIRSCCVCLQDTRYAVRSLAHLGKLLIAGVPTHADCLNPQAPPAPPEPTPAEQLADLILQIAREGNCE